MKCESLRSDTIFQCEYYTTTSHYILSGHSFQMNAEWNGISFFSSHLPEDLKSTSPPTLEPTGPAPPPRQGDAPLEPPTLRPITGEPQPLSWPCKRLKMDSDLSDGATENINCTKTQERPASPPPSLHSEGQVVVNGMPELSSPPRPTSGGVGRRTSVLFKKAKNGAKLFRDRDNALPNGKGLQDENTSNTPTATNSTASTPSSTPLSTPSKTPQKSPGPPALNEQWTPSRDMCSDGELERTPNHTLESGEQQTLLYPRFKVLHSGWCFRTRDQHVIAQDAVWKLLTLLLLLASRWLSKQSCYKEWQCQTIKKNVKECRSCWRQLQMLVSN